MSVRSFLMLYFHNKIYTGISIKLYDANKIDTRHLSLILLINGRKQLKDIEHAGNLCRFKVNTKLKFYVYFYNV